MDFLNGCRSRRLEQPMEYLRHEILGKPLLILTRQVPSILHAYCFKHLLYNKCPCGGAQKTLPLSKFGAVEFFVSRISYGSLLVSFSRCFFWYHQAPTMRRMARMTTTIRRVGSSSWVMASWPMMASMPVEGNFPMKEVMT